MIPTLLSNFAFDLMEGADEARDAACQAHEVGMGPSLSFVDTFT
jgi:hypothetical protein